MLDGFLNWLSFVLNVDNPEMQKSSKGREGGHQMNATFPETVTRQHFRM